MTPKKPQRISDATLFYIHSGLFAFSEIIFLLSLPILLWQRGFSLSFIFAFYAFESLPGYFFTLPIVQYGLKTHLKKIFTFGVFLYMVFALIAPLIQINNGWWMVAFFLLSIQALCYFPARYIYFSEIASRKTIGLQTGIVNAVMMIARTIAPIIAGFIALFTQLNWVFIFGAIFMLLSIIPILFIRIKIRNSCETEAFHAMRKEHLVFKNTQATYIAAGINGLLSYLLWPLLFFLFISQSGYFGLTSLMTVTYGISAVIMLVIGHFFDRRHRKMLLKGSVISNMLATVGRFALLFFHPLLFVYGIQSLYSFTESALQSTFESYLFSYSKITNTVFFTIHREMNNALGRFFAGAILAIASFAFSDVKILWFFFLFNIPVVLMYLQKGKIDYYLKK
ncbi:MFS transporter [Candidatus Peregrinibacteria bacterium]|nr:MFS transporter [Candidatus Peregrinibacteria bacterium]